MLWLFSEDDIFENGDDEAMEDAESFDETKLEDMSDHSDLSDLVNSEKRGSKIKIF